MTLNKGKQWEQKFKQDWLKSIPNSTIDRLYDSVSGYRSVSNISDFIGFKKPCIYYLECKSKKGSTFPFQNLTQYDKLVCKVGIEGVRVGVILWFYEFDKVWYVPIKTITQMKKDGKKSINLNTMEKDGYRFIEIPSIKKRVFMDSDYSVLTTLDEGD